jgi:Na+/melibiose symporter-like transporter
MGMGNGGTMIMPPAMTADAVDHDELQSGVQQTGGHMAFLAFVFKSGMGFGAFLGLSLLQASGYVNLAQVLDPGVENAVRFAASWLPALMLVAPIAMMWNYPIDTARHSLIRSELELRRSDGSAQAIAPRG